MVPGAPVTCSETYQIGHGHILANVTYLASFLLGRESSGIFKLCCKIKMLKADYRNILVTRILYEILTVVGRVPASPSGPLGLNTLSSYGLLVRLVRAEV